MSRRVRRGPPATPARCFCACAVERRRDGEPAAQQQPASRSSRVVAERLVVLDRLEHEVAEERRRWSRCSRCAATFFDGLRSQLGGLRRRRPPRWWPARPGHPREHDVAAGQSAAPGCAIGSNAVGCCTMPASSAACGKREVAGVGAEVAAGGGLDAVGAGAEVGDVEVALEDLVLGVLLLERHRVAQLAQLAGVRLLGRRLLRRGPLLRRPRCRRADSSSTCLTYCWVSVEPPCTSSPDWLLTQRAQGAREVDAAVLVEAGVLDGDDGLAHDRRDLGQRDRDAVLVVEGRDQRAVGGQDPGALGQRRDLQLGRAGDSKPSALSRAARPSPPTTGRRDAGDEERRRAR